ncbi:hypothetical protein [Ligilactobacillus equi]|uniref:hypothetical protein n=1 Tax=Ligilactobacillus equi TaxID=137357 RepID=UPI00046A37C1|nr:hypothetical protein [Ligilactobacillus equi]
MKKITGIITFPFEFEQTHSVEIFKWVNENKNIPNIINITSKIRNKVSFSFEAKESITQFIANGNEFFGKDNFSAYEGLINSMVKHNEVFTIDCFEHDTITHKTSKLSFSVTPSFSFPNVSDLLEKEHHLSDYEAYIMHFEPAINIYSMIGQRLLKDVLGYSQSKTLNVSELSRKLENNFLAIWKLNDPEILSEIKKDCYEYLEVV